MLLNAIDIFSGGGGLSEGMRQAGFNVLAAIESDHNVLETYRANHQQAKIIDRDVRFVSSAEVLQHIGLAPGQVDLVAGCPPCQGFSSLTSKYKRVDERNSLLNQMTRLVLDLRPRAIMIENVPGIMTKGRAYLDEFLCKIGEIGYIADFKVLQVADFGVPQSRRRFVLLAGYKVKISIPQPTHSANITSGLPKWRTVHDAISELPEPMPLAKASIYGGPQALNWHVTRNMSELNSRRLSHIRPGGMRFDLPDELRPDCHKGLDKGFSNVYGRMAWDSPAPTITGGCVTLSKGRFGHPEQQRTISVREAARLQSFPDSYKFVSPHIDHVCKIIGNALPCEFARVMSKACRDALPE